MCQASSVWSNVALPVSCHNTQPHNTDCGHEGDCSTNHHQTDGVEAKCFMRPLDGSGVVAAMVMKGNASQTMVKEGCCVLHFLMLFFLFLSAICPIEKCILVFTFSAFPNFLLLILIYLYIVKLLF